MICSSSAYEIVWGLARDVIEEIVRPISGLAISMAQWALVGRANWNGFEPPIRAVGLRERGGEGRPSRVPGRWPVIRDREHHKSCYVRNLRLMFPVYPVFPLPPDRAPSIGGYFSWVRGAAGRERIDH